MNIREVIESILDNYLLEDFRTCSDMIEEGLIDSFDMIQILTAIEEELNVIIEMSDIERSDLKDVDSIEALVMRKMDGE